MNFVERFYAYKIWYFPRKGVYRASMENDPRTYLYINHTKDFKSVDDLKQELSKQVQSNIHYTDPYNIAIQWLRKEENKVNEYYKEINLLVGQYSYGVEVKKELRDKLILIGVL